MKEEMDGSGVALPGASRPIRKPILLGTKTAFGTVASVGYKDGERWYMLELDGLVTLLPAYDLEASEAKPAEASDAEQSPVTPTLPNPGGPAQ